MSLMQAYYDFWALALGVSVEALRSGQKLSTVHGRYLDKHGHHHCFLFVDLKEKTQVFAGSCNGFSITATVARPDDDLTDLKNHPIIEGAELLFKDVDFCLSEPNDFKPVDVDRFLKNDLHLHSLSGESEVEFAAFQQLCSEDDLDTLDLDLETDKAVGIYFGDALVGVSRFIQIRDTSLADITVLVAPAFRGQGLAAILVSEIVKRIFEFHLVPKYRTDDTNLSSSSIARKLGFAPSFRLFTWKSH
jgi:RimJ/RimL family protein N-acetyltransferase